MFGSGVKIVGITTTPLDQTARKLVLELALPIMFFVVEVGTMETLISDRQIATEKLPIFVDTGTLEFVLLIPSLNKLKDLTNVQALACKDQRASINWIDSFIKPVLEIVKLIVLNQSINVSQLSKSFDLWIKVSRRKS